MEFPARQKFPAKECTVRRLVLCRRLRLQPLDHVEDPVPRLGADRLLLTGSDTRLGPLLREGKPRGSPPIEPAPAGRSSLCLDRISGAITAAMDGKIAAKAVRLRRALK